MLPWLREKRQDKAQRGIRQQQFSEIINTGKLQAKVYRERMIRVWRVGMIMAALAIVAVGLWGILEH